MSLKMDLRFQIQDSSRELFKKRVRLVTWHIMEDVSLPLPTLLRPLLTLTALATESHRDLTHSCHAVMTQ